MKIGSYPKPFFPIIFFEIVPFSFPVTFTILPLGYLNERTQLKNDYFIKISRSNHYLDIETNKNKSARFNFDKLNFKSNKTSFLIDLLQLNKDEYIENCFRHENLLD